MRATRSDLHVARLAGLRGEVYTLLARAFLYPDTARVVRLVDDARRSRQHEREALAFAFAVPWLSFLDELADPALDAHALEAAYMRAFVHDGTDAVCPAVESAYRTGGQGALLAALEREYRGAGLAPSPGATTTPDHAAVELEYLGFLCAREAEVSERDAPSEAARLRARQLAFLDAHLGSWMPAFAQRLAAVATHTVYAALARATWAFVVHDRDLLGLFGHEP